MLQHVTAIFLKGIRFFLKVGVTCCNLYGYIIKYRTFSVTCTVTCFVTWFIISMTKLLDADWLRGVQLFH